MEFELLFQNDGGPIEKVTLFHRMNHLPWVSSSDLRAKPVKRQEDMSFAPGWEGIQTNHHHQLVRVS